MTGRVDRLLGACLLISRKEAQAAVRAGRVRIDGILCHDPAAKADNDRQSVMLDGMPVQGNGLFYLMLYKPAGILSATEDGRGAMTALDLLPDRWKKAGLGVCGRLDKDAEGLLLLTNDGVLNHRLTAPRRHMNKKYLVTLDKPADEKDKEAFSSGMVLSDFTALPAELAPISGHTAYVTLREGKFHQIKRMFSARGKHVVFLKRISIGPLALDPKLLPGDWRELTDDEKRELLNPFDRL